MDSYKLFVDVQHHLYQHHRDNFRDVVMVYTRFYAIRVPLTAIKCVSTTDVIFGEAPTCDERYVRRLGVCLE